MGDAASRKVGSSVDSVVQILLVICLVLVCLLCMGCLILVSITIHLAVVLLQSPPSKEQLDTNDGSQTTIKTLAGLLEKVLYPLINQTTSLLTSTTTTTQDSTTLPKMTSKLQAITAVSLPISRQDLVFNVSASGIISYWASQNPDETTDLQYLSNNITVNGDLVRVNPQLSIISAIAFKSQGQDQVRVYYVDQNNLYIREIIRIGTGPWTFGSNFNNMANEIGSTSGLSADAVIIGDAYCDNPNYQLKVYCQRENGNVQLYYNVINSTSAASTDTWSNRNNITQQ